MSIQQKNLEGGRCTGKEREMEIYWQSIVSRAVEHQAWCWCLLFPEITPVMVQSELISSVCEKVCDLDQIYLPQGSIDTIINKCNEKILQMSDSDKFKHTAVIHHQTSTVSAEEQMSAMIFFQQVSE